MEETHKEDRKGLHKVMEGYHRSVLLLETIEALGVEKDSWYLDATLGDGGHTLEILKKEGKVLGIDADPQALKRAEGRFGLFRGFKLIQGNFRDLKILIQKTELKDQKFAGAIFDLGVSSLQLENPERGFSFAKNGPLDMRMDPSLQVKAVDLLNLLSRKELYELFKSLGEEKYSWSLAGALVSTRQVRPLTTTSELAELVTKVVRGVRGKIHPATKVFQALRIAVNDELGALKEGLDLVKDLVEKNGHIIVISFHSLEDRIAKFTFRQWEDRGLGKVETRKPVISKSEEVNQNPRSRSAKMRVFKIL